MNTEKSTKEYVSMAQAAGVCSYDQEYLSLLARRGLLQAEKIGGKWYTTYQWINDYLREKRPNEIIEEETEQKRKGEKISNNPIIFKGALIALGAIFVTGIFFYWYTMHRLNQLEKKVDENIFTSR